MNAINKPMGVGTGSAWAVDNVNGYGVSGFPGVSEPTGTCFAMKPDNDPFGVPAGPSERVNGSLLSRNGPPSSLRPAAIRPSMILPAYERYICEVVGDALKAEVNPKTLRERIMSHLPPTVWSKVGRIYECYLDLAVPGIVASFPECEVPAFEAIDGVKAALRRACVVEKDFDPATSYAVAVGLGDAYEERFAMMEGKFKDSSATWSAHHDATVKLLQGRLEEKNRADIKRLKEEIEALVVRHEQELERVRGQHKRKVEGVEAKLNRSIRDADHQRHVATKSRSLARRLSALRDLVGQLGVVQDVNQGVGLRHMKNALGVQFGKVYEVDNRKKTWWNPNTTSVKEPFAQPTVPEDGSAMALINTLWHYANLPQRVDAAMTGNEFKWERFDGWAYLHVPVLDVGVRRRYFPKLTRGRDEFLYVAIGGRKDSGYEVYALRAPTKGGSIFSEREKREDLNVLGAIVAAMITARENAHHVKRLHELTSLDGLTQIFNRRYFDEMIAKEFARTRKSGLPLSLLLFDIDHFKSVNDTHGHQAGDEILRQVAGTLKGVIRDGDILARYGGEEFVIVAPDTDEAGAVEFAERVRIAVEKLRTRFGDKVIPVTISIGVATHKGTFADPEALIGAADKAVYRAKDNGRNQVVHSSPVR